NRSLITIDPVTTLAAADRALMAAGRFARAWEMTMAACEQVDATARDPRGYLFCDAYIARAIQLHQFDDAWRAAEYLRTNYPGYPALSLVTTGEFEKTPQDVLGAAGL